MTVVRSSCFSESVRVNRLAQDEGQSQLSSGVSGGAKSGEQRGTDCRMMRTLEEDVFHGFVWRVGLL